MKLSEQFKGVLCRKSISNFTLICCVLRKKRLIPNNVASIQIHRVALFNSDRTQLKINHLDITTYKYRIQFDAFGYSWFFIIFIFSCIQFTLNDNFLAASCLSPAISLKHRKQRAKLEPKRRFEPNFQVLVVVHVIVKAIVAWHIPPPLYWFDKKNRKCVIFAYIFWCDIFN